MKTVYIPKGETVSYESLVTDRLVIKGCVHVLGDVRAKTISGNGVLHAGSVQADVIRLDELESAGVICRRLLAKRVQAPEVIASDCAVISCFLSAAYVETGKLTVAVSEISEIKAEEVVNLTPKKRGMLRTLLASALRSAWVALTAPKPKRVPVDAEYTPVEEAPAQEKETPDMDPAVKAEIIRTVREALEQDRAQRESEDSDAEDFELKRVVSTFKLLRSSGYTLRIVPGTPEENAPVFDPELEQILRPAA